MEDLFLQQSPRVPVCGDLLNVGLQLDILLKCDNRINVMLNIINAIYTMTLFQKSVYV